MASYQPRRNHQFLLEPSEDSREDVLGKIMFHQPGPTLSLEIEGKRKVPVLYGKRENVDTFKSVEAVSPRSFAFTSWFFSRMVFLGVTVETRQC